jgi:AcrR family transcriptional regulator
MDLVLDAAWEVLGRKSYDATTVEDIARAAEISVGTLYQLFRSKEDIYRELVGRQQRRFFEVVGERVDRAQTPIEQVYATVRAHMDLFAEYRKQWRLYVLASSGFSLEIKEQLAESVLGDHMAFLGRLTGICRAGLERGDFRAGVSPELLAVSILWLPHSFLKLILEDEHRDVDALVPGALEAVGRIVGIPSSTGAGQ